MGGKAASVLLLALVIFVPARLSGQEVFSPLIVEGPRISRTAFTNWENIELIYTVRWMEGYEPIRTELKPQAMSFGILELDPEFAEEVDIKNERKFEKENYFNITYHLRYMGEKKGEIVVPGQKFAYRNILSSESSAVQYFPTQEFKLAYGTVLTSDAEDIKEEFDLGSYQKTATSWKVFAVIIIIIGIVGSFALIFFRPVPAPLALDATGTSVSHTEEKRIDPAKMISELHVNIASGKIGAVCNGLNDMIRVHVPGIKPGMTSKDMKALVASIPYEWERNQFYMVHAALCDIEDNLFTDHGVVSDKVKHHLSHLTKTIQALSSWSLYWHRKTFFWKKKFLRPLTFMKRFNWRKPWT